MQEAFCASYLRTEESSYVFFFFLILKCAELKGNSPFQPVLICAAYWFCSCPSWGVDGLFVDDGEMLSV